MFKERLIRNIHLRYILNSNADKAIEAEVILENGYKGIASSPAAIIPGKRERQISLVGGREELKKDEEQLRTFLLGKKLNQEILDDYLNKLTEKLGTDICLAVSLAFAKAVAESEHMILGKYIFLLLNMNAGMRIPQIVVPVFSGGVHQKGRRDSFQQIMVGIHGDSLAESYQIAKDISYEAERRLKERGSYAGIASSGGYLTIGISTDEKLFLLQEILEDEKWKKSTFIAVDVAAEHLNIGLSYSLDGKILSSDEFYTIIANYIKRFSISYVEDPFDTFHTELWKKLKNEQEKRVKIIGDDLFATQKKYIDSELADGAVVKMNQVGNLSDTLKMIRRLWENEMTICVSHRSYETEDTAMCDLAIAAAAEYIKIGGVKRGERIIKYNQLLRLEEEVFAMINEEERKWMKY